MRFVLSSVVVVAAACLAGPASAQSAAGDRVLVYVDDVAAEPKLKQEAAALTSALCGALAKDKRLDVMCAPDVKQIIGFAASSAMMGTTSPALDNITKRMGAVKFVVAGTLAPRGGDVVLTVKAGPKSENSDVTSLFTEAPVVKIEEATPAKQMKLLERLPDVSQRLVKAIVTPAATTTTTTTPATPPPAPLKP